jgi:TRAP transporter TAXI family solute receptor
MKKVISLVLAMVMIFSLASCGKSTESTSTDVPQSTTADSTAPATTTEETPSTETKDPKADWPKFLTIGGGGTGAAFFAVATGVAQLITDELGIQANGQASNGGTHNLQLLASKEYELGMADNASASQAYDGTGAFENAANKDLRAICVVYAGYFAQQVRVDSGINNMDDIKGKRIAVGMPNSGTENITKAVYAAHGYDYTDKKDVIAEFVGASSGTDLVRNRQADGMTFFAPIPDAVQTELVVGGHTKLIGLNPDAIAKLTAEGSPYVAGTVPAGTYSNQKEDVQTIYAPMVLHVRADIDEELVYQITKLIFDNLDTLKLQHNAFANMTPENATTGIYAPLHPGAERYYKEIGVLK